MNSYLGDHETAVVIDLIASVAPHIVLEFGVNLGKTAQAILDAIPTIQLYIGIDLPPGLLPRLACQASEVPISVGQFAAHDPRFQVLLADSSTLETGSIELVDAIFIDGDHSAAGVEHDSRLALALLRPGGIVVWHDYGNTAVEVTEVLDKLAAEGWPICHFPNTWLAYMR